VIKQSNGSPTPTKTNGTPTPTPINDTPKFKLVGLQKAEQNAESLKTMKVFGKE
jgi:hypothetical protein